jgi:hypothetical protein
VGGGGRGGVLPPRSSFLSAKSRRPRFALRERPSPLDRDEESQSSLELDEPDEERGRPCVLTGSDELFFGGGLVFIDGDLDRERDDDDHPSLNEIKNNKKK